MKKIIWVLRLGIVVFGGILVFESVEAPKHQQEPRIYVVNPAAKMPTKTQPTANNGQLRLPHEVLHVSEVAPLVTPQALVS